MANRSKLDLHKTPGSVWTRLITSEACLSNREVVIVTLIAEKLVIDGQEWVRGGGDFA